MIGNKFVLALLASAALTAAPSNSFACLFCGGGHTSYYAGYTPYYTGYTPYYVGYWPATTGCSTCATTCCRPTCCVPNCCSSCTSCGSGGCATGCQGDCAIGARYHSHASRVPRTDYGMANRQPAVRQPAPSLAGSQPRVVKPQAVPAAAKPPAKSPAKAPVVKPAPQGPIAKSTPRANVAHAGKKAVRETVIPVRSTEARRLATLNRDWTPE
jgi:hypothetical protein